MNKEEIIHLAQLARIELSEAEIKDLEGELSSIVTYVSAVTDIADDGDSVPTEGVVYNVFRRDEVTNEPGEYTDRLVTEMPRSNDNYLVVKKILNTSE
jgi:aspartyl-tRNA(Asn)/glutamyl-tRNA(Gln) amidotransferase subunit C